MPMLRAALLLGDAPLVHEPLGEAKLLRIESADLLAQRRPRYGYGLTALELAQNRGDARLFELRNRLKRRQRLARDSELGVHRPTEPLSIRSLNRFDDQHVRDGQVFLRRHCEALNFLSALF